MAKYTANDVENMFNNSVSRISQNKDNWVQFLDKASSFYKYNFEEQLIIADQKPNATVCAEFDIWSKRFNGRINKNAKGIPLLKSDGHIRYVYDIADTNLSVDALNIWAVKDKDLTASAIDAVSGRQSDDLASAVNNFITDNVIPLINDYSNIDELVSDFSLMSNSIQYVIFSRMSLDTSDIPIVSPPKNDASIVGKIVSEITQAGLKQLESIVNRVNKEISKASIAQQQTQQQTQTQSKPQPQQQRLQPQHRQSVTFTKEQLDVARNTNLVNYLSSRGEKLKRVGSSEYTMANHDSMRINENNGFYWNSRGIGGNALDFCMQYYNMDFQSAVADLLAFNGQSVDIAINRPTTPAPQTTNTTPKENVVTEPYSPLLNPLSDETKRVYAYLTKTRNISHELVQQLIKSGQIAQDVKGNAIFKIFDENGNLSGAELSGTLSDKKYKNVTERNGNGFTINPLGDKTPEKAMFFESAIDALSYYSLHKDTDALLVSMAGLKDKVVLKALETHHIDFSNAIISSDIDKAGKSFAQKMQNQYDMSIHQIDTDELYTSVNQANLKDWNDLLQSSKLVLEKNNDNPHRNSIDTSDNEQTKEKKFFFDTEKTVNASENDVSDVELSETVNNQQSDITIADSNSFAKDLSKAIDRLIGNHDFSEDTKKLLRRVGVAVYQNEYTSSDFKLADVLAIQNFQRNYGSVSQINEKYLNGQLDTITSELDTYLGRTPENTVINDETSKQKQDRATQNYRITNSNLGIGTQKEKYHNNIDAIKTLLKIELENRNATPDEQEVLAKYVGWGGLADAFDENKTAWQAEYTELKELLTDTEYSNARSSTLNAHYTAPAIIDAMYKALENMGFENGKILEPAMGVGNFFGMLPESMKDSKLYGVELDSISGRIAKQLYPNANIQVKGFEKTSFTSNSFDVAIGNVPFGNYRINDNDFKDNDLIHDYFFKKSLDKVRQGGVVAFITSKGTLDKQDNSVRKYLAERADLLGAIRLPNNAFKANAGTEVTSDIIFLQKRENLRDFSKEEMPQWVNVGVSESGIEMNEYFVQNPDMILGEMAEVSGRFGMETTCTPIDGADLSQQLYKAVENINADLTIAEVDVSPEKNTLSSDINPLNYRNFCYAVVNDEIYFRENDDMILQEFDGKKAERLKGMIELSHTLQELMTAQQENYTDDIIQNRQVALNTVYDNFTKKFGLLSDKVNKAIFREDDTSGLLLALENIDDKGVLTKADIFTKRTIVPYIPIESVDTASEALAVSISEKAGVDLEYMSQLCSKTKDEIVEELKGVIFENPVTGKYETADEYLSGNVREKLKMAQLYAENNSNYDVNVKHLTEVQPEDLKASEISAQLGSTWIPTHYFEQFMYELLDTPQRCHSDYMWRRTTENPFASGSRGDNQTIMIDYDSSTATYGISNKSNFSADRDNIKANQTYGTSRMNAYKIIEETLNQKPIKVMDYIEDNNGNKRAVLNEKETLLAQEKQGQIKQKFQEWIFDDNDRTQDLCKIYNEKFNSIRPREYDGSHITFGGINPEITLRKHQVDAIAHTIYGGNTLLAHSVGAGKTFEMVASAMESKRLGLCTKSMIVVPKHIVNQVAKEFLQLYPTANILVPDEKDFSKANRQRFCSRIAMGNYDAVIISHNQFEKIPLSNERQIEFIQNEINEIVSSLETLKHQSGEKGFTIKQLEQTKKSLETRLEKLNNNEKRDTTITFEEMGIDKLFVDEAHLFKNLYFNSKMGRNVAGINASSASQRATDLFMKCRYLDEKTDSKGLCFATGTPLSNSMTELYTMMNYLQHNKLIENGLNNFDSWASCFGETQLALELAPEGKGYQMKTRFAKFFNLPELMSMFKEVADIKTADVLNLPVPHANFHTIVTEASQYQTDMVDGLAERANAIRQKMVSADTDNMLNVTNDGRKLALDQRIVNDLLPDDENSKVNTCINNVYDIWNKSSDTNGTQMIFCDLSTPHYDGKFNVYDDIKTKLISKGVPENEIAFIHDCKTDDQKQALFTKVRNGEVRILLGSTSKMGTGTNCQKKLTALHHLDCPWKPSDLEQRNGRIIRQGNENKEVDIFNYVTKGTFDSYLYQLVENKQKFISQIMTSKSPARSAEDIDETVLSYAQIKALASGNPKIKEKMDLDIEVSRLRTVFSMYQTNKRTLQQNISQTYPEKIQKLNAWISNLEKDIVIVKNSKTSEFSSMLVDGQVYSDKKEAGTAFLESCRKLTPDKKSKLIGEYRGFTLGVTFNAFSHNYEAVIKGSSTHKVEIGNDIYGNITRLDNLIDGLPKKLNTAKVNLSETEHLLSVAKEEVKKPFPRLAELREKEGKLEKLNKELSSDKELEVTENSDKTNQNTNSKKDVALR